MSRQKRRDNKFDRINNYAGNAIDRLINSTTSTTAHELIDKIEHSERYRDLREEQGGDEFEDERKFDYFNNNLSRAHRKHLNKVNRDELARENMLNGETTLTSVQLVKAVIRYLGLPFKCEFIKVKRHHHFIKECRHWVMFLFPSDRIMCSAIIQVEFGNRLFYYRITRIKNPEGIVITHRYFSGDVPSMDINYPAMLKDERRELAYKHALDNLNRINQVSLAKNTSIQSEKKGKMNLKYPTVEKLNKWLLKDDHMNEHHNK